MSLTTSACVTKEAPTLTHQNHPKSIVYLGFNVDAIHSVGFDKSEMAYTHHDNAIQSTLSALTILCALPVNTSPLPLVITDVYIESIVLLSHC